MFVAAIPAVEVSLANKVIIFSLINIPCHDCYRISLPFTDVISTNAVTCRYSRQSIRRRNYFVVDLAKGKHFIRKISNSRYFCSCGNGAWSNISLSPKK